MDKVVVDTNILIYVLTENPYKKEIKEKLKKVEEVFIPLHILIEFILVCKYKLKIEESEVYKAVEEIKNTSILVDTFLEDFFNALELAKKYNVPLNEINDLILVSIAKRLKASLFTYDEKLREIAKKEGIKLI